MSLVSGGNLNVGGKHIPLSVVAIIGAVGVALLIVRSLSQNQQQLALGSAPAPVDLTGSFQPVLDQLQQAAQNLNQAAGIRFQQGPAPAIQPAPQGIGTTIQPPSAPWVTLTGAQTGIFAAPGSGPGGITGLVTWLPGGSQLQSAGAPVLGTTPFGASSGYWAQSAYWQPVRYQGQTYYVWAPFSQPNPSQGTGAPIN